MTVLVYGTRPCLWLPVNFNLPPVAYPWLILFGLVLGVLAWCYQYCLLNNRVWYRHCTHLPSKVQPLLPLLLVIPVGLLDVNLLGGSHMLIDHLIALPSHSAAFASLFGLLSIYFVVRFVGSKLSYGAPVPGGIFMPILVIGAILGALLATLLIHLHLLAAYFGRLKRPPSPPSDY